MAKSHKKKTFLKKLIAILNNKSYEKYISWDKGGKAIIIRDEKKFAENILSKCFSHKNFSSFVRQLNLYNFKGKRHKDGHLRYENENFFKNMSNEGIDKIEAKDKKTKLIIINNKEQNNDENENIIDISNEKKLNYNEFREKLDKCLNEMEEILNNQKKLFKEIENLKKEKRKNDNNLNLYFKNSNKDINKSGISFDII